jgi:serine/threonine-protein kinase RsbW
VTAPIETDDPGSAQPDLELSFPPRPEYVRMARHTLAALARLHDVSEDVIDDLKLAVSEACTNAVTVNAPAQEPVHLVAMVDGSSVEVRVLDVGPGIDLALLDRDPELSSDEFSFERGLSLPVVRGLVDELQIEPREPKGSVLRMRLSFVPSAPG